MDFGEAPPVAFCHALTFARRFFEEYVCHYSQICATTFTPRLCVIEPFSHPTIETINTKGIAFYMKKAVPPNGHRVITFLDLD